jgi:hypothetical protein
MDAIFIAIGAGSIFVAAELAQRRGRSLKMWAWIGALIGPFAIPMLFLLPRLPAPAEGAPRA